MNKTELIQYVKQQTGIELVNDSADTCNKKRKVLYTQIPRNNYYSVAPALIKKGCRLEQHIRDYYFVHFN